MSGTEKRLSCINVPEMGSRHLPDTLSAPKRRRSEPAPPVQDIAPPRPRTRQTEDGIYYN